MSLIKYNSKSKIKPFGFRNMGVTCYFNSLIQSLLSCTSFVDVLYNDKKKYMNHPITNLFIQTIDMVNSGNTTGIEEMSPKIWSTMIAVLSKLGKTDMLGISSGQQCSGEAFDCLMYTIDEFKDIQNLFIHRYKTVQRCFDCNEWISEVNSIENIVRVPPDLKYQQLDKFNECIVDQINDCDNEMNKLILRQIDYVDKDRICPLCKTKGEKLQVSCLVMAREIIIVLAKKFSNNLTKINIYTDFPEYMSFNGKNNKKLKYKAVSQIEHAGNLNGGHYWTISKRDDGWYILNDTSVESGEFKPTNNTYMVFYHLV